MTDLALGALITTAVILGLWLLLCIGATVAGWAFLSRYRDIHLARNRDGGVSIKAEFSKGEADR